MKTAIIWGANGDIGMHFQKSLASQGWKVYGISLHVDRISGFSETTFSVDLSNPSAIQDTILKISQEVDQIDLSVYAAGDIIIERVSAMPSRNWQRILDANLNGAFYSTQACLPMLAKDASIIYIGAITERLRLPGFSAYATAKAGLETFVSVLAKEERSKKILLVRPAAVDTRFWQNVPMKLPKQAHNVEKFVGLVLDAYKEGKTGTLDF